jgi:hypothetical protein
MLTRYLAPEAGQERAAIADGLSFGSLVLRGDTLRIDPAKFSQSTRTICRTANIARTIA